MVVTLLTILCVAFVTGAIGQTACPRGCKTCQNGVADCSQGGMLNPPKGIDKETKTVNIDGNVVRVLGKRSFNSLPNLEVLRASGNRIRVVKKESFVTMPKLMTLDLSNNKISRIYSKSFVGLENLKTLTLVNNNIATVTGILDIVPSLFQLNLGRNKIRTIHAKTFYKNVRLHYLDLRYNNLVRIHADSFKHQKYLRYLFLNNNPIANLPALNIGSPVLQLIDLSHCKLRRIPQGFPSSVHDLRLGHNEIQHVRKRDLENITSLRLLALNNNKIEKVAFLAFRKLVNLQEIWLRDNNLIYIPRGLPDNLRKLYMDSNNVVTVEAVLFSNLSRIEYLTLENNRVQDINPKALAQLKNLKYLNLQGNQLITLTKGMFNNVRNITTLTLSNNPIAKIERGAFGNLDNLTSLYMSYIPQTDRFMLDDNFLSAMPNLEKLGLMGSQSLAIAFLRNIHTAPVMSKMKELDLTFNDIQTFPPALKNIVPNIQALSVDGNSLICDDRLLWLAKWMKSSDVKFFSYEEPKCEEPYINKGKLVKDVPEADFVPIRRELPPLPPLPDRPPVQRQPVESPRVQSAPVQTAPARRIVKSGGPSPARQVAAAKEVEAKKTVKPSRSNRRRGRRLRNKQRRSKTERKRRRKRRHRKTDEERRKQRRKKGKGRKRKGRKDRKKKTDETSTAAPVN